MNGVSLNNYRYYTLEMYLADTRKLRYLGMYLKYGNILHLKKPNVRYSLNGHEIKYQIDNLVNACRKYIGSLKKMPLWANTNEIREPLIINV